MKRLASILILAFLMFGQIGEFLGMPTGLAADISEFYSFENDTGGWSNNGTDLDRNEWTITRSQDMASDGSTALKLDLTNNNDRGKIWIEKSFPVEPNHLYAVNVNYSFASADGPLGAFDIMTGVLKQRPTTRDDLIPTFRESTDRRKQKQGYRWFDKHYQSVVPADQATNLWVVIGIAGNFEVRNVYYVDSVRVEITTRPEESRFYTFENDMQGWTANSTNLATGDWSISHSAEIWVDGASSLKIDLNNQSAKGEVWIERPFEVEPGNKYRVNVDYAFSSRNFSDYRIIARVFRSPPLTADDLFSAHQDETPVVPLWWPKSYEFTMKSKKSSTLYVVIGVLGTAQTQREYFIDSLCVTLTKK